MTGRSTDGQPHLKLSRQLHAHWLLACLVGVGMLCGCNADPGARREVQLLRAEILELEDRYYALKHRSGDAANSPGNPASANTNYYCEECGTFHNGNSGGGNSGGTVGAGTPFSNFESTPNYLPNKSSPSSEIQIENSQPAPQNTSPEPIEIDIGDSQGKVNARPAPNRQVDRNSNVNDSSAPDLFDRDSDFLESLTEDTSQVGQNAKSASFNGDNVEFKVQAISNDSDTQPDGLMVSMSNTKYYVDVLRMEVSLMNPQLPRGQQRIGYWNFDPSQVNRSIRDIRGKQELRLFAPWQTMPSGSEALVVFVRIHTSDGNQSLGTQTLILDENEIPATQAKSSDLITRRGTHDMDASVRSSSASDQPRQSSPGSKWRQAR